MLTTLLVSAGLRVGVRQSGFKGSLCYSRGTDSMPWAAYSLLLVPNHGGTGDVFEEGIAGNLCLFDSFACVSPSRRSCDSLG